MEQLLTFSLVLKEIPVVLQLPDGKEMRCVLREFDGRTRDAFFNSVRKQASEKSEQKEDEVRKVIPFDGYEANFLCLCLFDVSGKTIPKDDIQNWPVPVITALFETAKKMNGMTVEKEEISKKE